MQSNTPFEITFMSSLKWGTWTLTLRPKSRWNEKG